MAHARLDLNHYRAFLLDPESSSRLSLKRGRLVASATQRALPMIADIPVALRHPQAFFSDWKMKCSTLVSYFFTKSKRAREETRRAPLMPLTLKRLSTLQAAYGDNAKVLAKILAPLASISTTPSPQEAFYERIPKQLAVMAYHRNVFRDWAWGASEIEAQVNVITRHTTSCKNLLVLGAGTCGLALRLHEALAAEKTVAVDMHPVLFLITRRLMTHRSSVLYEFPHVPLSMEFAAVKHKLKLIHRPDTFLMLIADAQDLPIENGHFDTIVTPWLIDVIPQNISDFARKISSYLPKNGVWVNLGLLAYERNRLGEQLSPQEIHELLRELGFKVEEMGLKEIPYLQSPYEAFRRTDRVLHFRAVKVKEAKEPKRFQYLPEWLSDWSKPVPKLPEMQSLQSKSQVYLQVLSMIDGKKTVTDLASAFSEGKGLTSSQAEDVVAGFLTNVFENFIYREF